MTARAPDRSSSGATGESSGPAPWAAIDHWYALPDAAGNWWDLPLGDPVRGGARVPDEPDQDKPTHRIGCPWDLLVFVATVLLVFAVVVFCGWIALRGSGVL